MLVVATGCIEPELVACGDNVCPATAVCLQDQCIPRAQLAACVGLADGDACTVPPSSESGICVAGVCSVARCGNAVVEFPEACDDGNTLSGDGCGGTCRSDETCGNGISELAEQCDCGSTTAPSDAALCGDTYNGELICRDDCTLRRCGDGLLDPGEVCDDGNLVTADGCRADCMSEETCGNGVVDFAVGEQCDDDNLRNRDGCAASCLVESLAWRPQPQGATPSARGGAAMAYDAARRRVVMFGGTSAFATGNLGDTWEWDGTRFSEVTPASGVRPSARTAAAMVYDAARKRIVMFGGVTGSGSAFGDTWEWDGTIWRRLTPSNSPPPRWGAAATYDAARKRVVLFGGGRIGAVLGDTWEWDGVTWTERTPATSPPTRHAAGMAYDPARGRVVMFGGSGNKNDTWEWDGASWSDRTPSTNNPPAVATSLDARTSMVYDPVTNQVLLFAAGQAGTSSWNGTKWTERTVDPEFDYVGAAVTYDVERRRVFLFGGGGNGAYSAETWDGEWDATTTTLSWTTRGAAAEPSPGGPLAMFYDAVRARIVMLLPAGATYARWEWAGHGWTQLSSVASPPARVGAMFAYDPARRRLVLFGGQSQSGVLSDTWEWNVDTWTLMERTPLSPAPSPPARIAAAMSYDGMGIVLYGGMTGTFVSDTWRWDGTTWTEHVAASYPPARSGPTMAYDAVRRVAVLYGGTFGSARPYTDTWEWDGTGWTVRSTIVSPPSRLYAAMVYDDLRERVVLFGGSNVVGLVVDDADRWEWDGADWTSVSSLSGPSPRGATRMAFDAARSEVVLFGGHSGNQDLGDTWTLGYTPLTAPEACASGIDYDRDGAIGCEDDECWGTCAPLCPPWRLQSCALVPGCDDGTCSALEDWRSCPSDCTGGPITCGDFHCDPGETVLSCPGDCS